MAAIDLPLFPLGQVVLAPAMPLPLHIFEARYREMVAECLQDDRRFGVVLVRDGSEVGDTAIPHDIGTVAEITASTRMDDGRYGIWTEGRERFRILERYYDRSYLHGLVELLDEPLGVPENVEPLAREVTASMVKYQKLIASLEGTDQDTGELPHDAIALSYHVLGTLQVLDREKQSLLEAVDAEDRLRQEVHLLQRELLILNKMLTMTGGKSGLFNPN